MNSLRSRYGWRRAMCNARMLVTIISLVCCCVNSFIFGGLKNGCAFVNYCFLPSSIFLMPTICVGIVQHPSRAASRQSIFIFCRLIPFRLPRDSHLCTVAVVETVLNISNRGCVKCNRLLPQPLNFILKHDFKRCLRKRTTHALKYLSWELEWCENL